MEDTSSFFREQNEERELIKQRKKDEERKKLSTHLNECLHRRIQAETQ
jgi:hypothetical protein